MLISIMLFDVGAEYYSTTEEYNETVVSTETVAESTVAKPSTSNSTSIAPSEEFATEPTTEPTTEPSTEPVIESIILNAEKLKLGIGEFFTLDAELDTGKNNIPFSFYSSDENIATVDEKGIIKAVSEGTAYITVAVDDISAK